MLPCVGRLLPGQRAAVFGATRQVVRDRQENTRNQRLCSRVVVCTCVCMYACGGIEVSGYQGVAATEKEKERKRKKEREGKKEKRYVRAR